MLFRPIWNFLAGVITDRASAQEAEGEPPGAYTAVLFREKGLRARFMLQKRVRPDKLYYGRIAMFGGHREGDESPLACAVREVEEETGLRLDESELTRVAAIKAFDNRGDVAIGHLFFVDDFDPRRLDPRKVSAEGRLVRLSEKQLARNFRRFTPITAMAILLFFEFEALNAPD